MAAMMASTLAASRPSEKFGTHSTIRFIGSLSWELSLLRVDDGPAFHGHAAEVHTKIIRDFAVVGHVKRGDVSKLANFDGADAIMNAEGVGGIDGSRGDGFGWGHAHLGAGQRKNHGDAQGRAGAGIEIGGEAKDRAGLDELARGSIVREAEMKAAAGEQGADDVGETERSNVVGVDLFQMISAGGGNFDREAGRTVIGEVL